jgi:hypothetical protein
MERMLPQSCRVCRAWNLGVKSVVQSLYNEQVFSDAVGTFRNHHTSTFQFAAMRKVDESTGGALTTDSGPSTIPFEIGGDGVQVLNFGQRTVSVLGIRCLDLPPHLSHTRFSSRPLIVVEGKKEKSALTCISCLMCAAPCMLSLCKLLLCSVFLLSVSFYLV